MIEKLSIKNFKSLKDLELDCRKINLFIGEPNAGKSNILEALGLLSWCGRLNKSIDEYVRLDSTQNLFYDEFLDREIVIDIHKEPPLRITFHNEMFQFFTPPKEGNKGRNTICKVDYSFKSITDQAIQPMFQFIKFYRFKFGDYSNRGSSFLMTPNGNNMFAVVMGNRKLREIMAQFFKNYGFRLVLKPQERKFEFQKHIDDYVIIYPYILTSDTLQRIIFHVIAIESNENSTLVFEEPESHAFPYYTKYLGEKIAFDETNQYFIATHNPYLLLSILEKAPKESVNVFITYFRDYQTKVKSLTEEQISELMDYDPFFNLNSFLEEEESN